MKKVVLIAFGTMGSGKDTYCDMVDRALARKLTCASPSARVERLAFADSIKAAAQVFFGMPRSVAYGTQADKLSWIRHGKTARDLLQWLGQHLREGIHPDVLVSATCNRVKASDAQIFLVSDGRFTNELSVPVRELGQDAVVLPVFVYRSQDSEIDYLRESYLGRHGLWDRFRGWLASRSPGLKKHFHPTELEVFRMGLEARERIQAGSDASPFARFVCNAYSLEHLELEAEETATMILDCLSFAEVSYLGG